MQVSRDNEKMRTWFRSERVFLENQTDWYFQTREGVDVGPYESQFEAEIEAGLLKELVKDMSDSKSIMAVIHEFILDSDDMGRPLHPKYRHESMSTALHG